MKIYSWNIWFRNKRLDEAFAYIKSLDFDILCLQEVPEDFLERLKTLPYVAHYAPEVDRLLEGVLATQYVVILSRFPIGKTGIIPVPDWDQRITLRTTLFVTGMVALGLWSWGKGNRHAIYADVETQKRTVRIFDLHLPLTFPAGRRDEFEMALAHKDASIPLIVAGDFNIIESSRVSILNYILGGRLSDVFLWGRERRELEARILTHGLQNPLAGKRTHDISGSQLDHILVPKGATIIRAEVVKDPHGSDHNPVFVEYEIK